MRRIIFREEESDQIDFAYIDENDPVFAKKDDKLSGMLVKEGRGWILRTGGDGGCSGFHDTILKCIADAKTYGYTFYTAS